MAGLIEQLAGATPERAVRLGRYDVIGKIGQGGMGTVYDAVDAAHGGRVALKTLTHLDANSLVRFKNEFRAVADLSHPNLVSLHELACHDDLWFFTMERIDGVDFIEWLRGEPMGTLTPAAAAQTIPGSPLATRKVHARQPNTDVVTAGDLEPSLPPSVPQLRAALAQFVAAVHALHEAGLLHQDLKPSNVLVEASGRVVVLDFGLVRNLADADSPMRPDALGSVSISGTPMWMAPEQFVLGPTGAAADWYAVGLMLYMGLTGVPAFPLADDVATGHARQHLVPRPPHDRLDGVPADLSALTAALLAKDPAERPTGETLMALLSGDEGRRSLAARRIEGRGFVGRHDERARLRAALAVAAGGEAALVHVSGGSGMGKSALLRSVLGEVHSGDKNSATIVLRGRCYERESVPYKAFDGIMDELAARLVIERSDRVEADLPARLAELAGVFPVLAAVPAIAAWLAATPAVPASVPASIRRGRAVEALRDWFTRLAARRPVTLVIDDLQWADEDSITVLRQLLASPPIPGLLVAACYREDEALADPVVAEYLAWCQARVDVHVDTMSLAALTQPDAATLAGGILAAMDVSADGLELAIADESAGVPFFVEELARFVAEHYQPGADNAVATAGISLDKVLAWRAQSLPEPERNLLEALAVANSPIPLSIAFQVAGVAIAPMRALWALRGKRLIRATGVTGEDGVELHHDRMRESVCDYLTDARRARLHLDLGLVLAERVDAGDRVWLFDAVRHLNAAASVLSPRQRIAAARLAREAGQRARRAGAFRLAFDCFRDGVTLLGAAGWDADYALALALDSGAAEAAYLCSEWDIAAAHIARVKEHGRTALDQLDAWEVQIDAAIARRDYAGAVDAALAVLRLLDVDIPAHPDDAEVGAAVQAAMASLAEVGPDGVLSLKTADDPRAVATMRLEARIVSAAYFGRPTLLPVLASRVITTSVRDGLAPATAYALAVHGIVLNTLGMQPDAHVWGGVALKLLKRFDDRSFEARTRHVVHNLVCVWTVPLADTLEHIRRAVDVGQETGDIEYAAYAAHAYAHNALYTGRPLAQVVPEALALGDFMRGHEEVNALHFHVLFEQLLRSLIGDSDNPASLNGNGFDEAVALAAGDAADSHSAQCLVRVVMGMARYAFGAVTEASALFEQARAVFDGIASTWHVPMFHQYAALSIHGLPPVQRAALREHAEADLTALRALAAHGAVNFAHRVALVEAESARADGDLDAAFAAYERAWTLADAGGWINDVALAHELAARCHDDAGHVDRAAHHRALARDLYTRWGAHGKAARLAEP